jgi:SAM-dependent methyltransferase
VAVYRRLPPGVAEAELIHAAVPASAELLELGSGTGRVTRPLVALGHAVIAVDQSAAMLAELAGRTGVTPVQADIERLDLDRRVPGVVMGSHLVNTEDPLRAAFLEAARRHVAPDGVVLIEAYDPDLDWPSAVGRRSELGPIAITVARAVVDWPRLDAEVVYEVDGRIWRQPFVAVLYDDAGLRAVLAGHGLHMSDWIDRRRGWLVARPV